jgi:Omp85 superfamily domain
METAGTEVSASRLGVTKDLPEWLREKMGRKKPASEEPAPGARKITWAPYITVSPLVGTGFGVGLAGTRQRGDVETTRLSKFSASVLVTTEKQFSAPLRTNINLPGGNWNLVGLWRWSRFPTPTWGIGGNTPESAETTIDYQLLRLYEIVNRRVATNFYLGAGYALDYYFNVKDRAAGTGRVTDFQTYPYGTGSTSFNSALVLNVLYDSRDSPVFATRGFYGNLSYAFTPEWLGSDTTWQSAYLDLRAYRKLAPRWVLGLWSYAWFNFGHVPYLELSSIGSDPDNRSGRGYIEGRHIGKALLYGEAELRFVIWEWLGAITSVNVHSAGQPEAGGIVQDEPRFQHWWPAVVVGARILAVKATHSNVCIDFAWGRNGQNGVYFNFAEAF